MKKNSLHCIMYISGSGSMDPNESGSDRIHISAFRLYDLMYFPRQIRPIFDKTRIGIQFHLHMISTKG